MDIIYAKSASKTINSMNKSIKDRIKAGIEGLTQIPPVGDIKPLKGYDDGRKRLRIGNYRIIYRYGLKNQVVVLFIMDIGSRGDIYK